MMKKPKEFIAEIKINYSDDAGNSMEKRFVFKPENTYDDFMSESDKMFAFVRATYGSTEFDDMQKEKEAETKTPKVVITDQEV